MDIKTTVEERTQEVEKVRASLEFLGDCLRREVVTLDWYPHTILTAHAGGWIIQRHHEGVASVEILTAEGAWVVGSKINTDSAVFTDLAGALSVYLREVRSVTDHPHAIYASETERLRAKIERLRAEIDRLERVDGLLREERQHLETMIVDQRQAIDRLYISAKHCTEKMKQMRAEIEQLQTQAPTREQIVEALVMLHNWGGNSVPAADRTPLMTRAIAGEATPQEMFFYDMHRPVVAAWFLGLKG